MRKEEEKWELVPHSHQIADTGDYDGCYEITNGKVSIFSKDDDEESLLPIIEALNNSGCNFYLDDSQHWEIESLKLQLEEYREQRWVKVEDSLPDSGQEVLVVTKYGVGAAEFSTRRASDSAWLLANYGTVGNTYYPKDKIKLWMPLPEPTKQKP